MKKIMVFGLGMLFIFLEATYNIVYVLGEIVWSKIYTLAPVL